MTEKRVVVIESPWHCPWNMPDLEAETINCAKVEPRRACFDPMVGGFPAWCPLPKAEEEK